MNKLKFDTIGRLLTGQYKGWYILIKHYDDDSYHVFVSQRSDMKGGRDPENPTIRVGYNTLFPQYTWMINDLHDDGVIHGDVVEIEWLEENVDREQ